MAEEIEICELLAADGGTDCSYVATKGGRHVGAYYLFEHKPEIRKIKDEYGETRQWVGIKEINQ